MSLVDVENALRQLRARAALLSNQVHSFPETQGVGVGVMSTSGFEFGARPPAPVFSSGSPTFAGFRSRRKAYSSDSSEDEEEMFLSDHDEEGIPYSEEQGKAGGVAPVEEEEEDDEAYLRPRERSSSSKTPTPHTAAAARPPKRAWRRQLSSSLAAPLRARTTAFGASVSMREPRSSGGWRPYSSHLVPTGARGLYKTLICGLAYTGTGDELRCPVSDARKVQRALQNFGFRSRQTLSGPGNNNPSMSAWTKDEAANLHMLVQQKAHLPNAPTKANMLMGLEWLQRDCRRGDVLLFYFGGRLSTGGALCPLDYLTEGVIEPRLLAEVLAQRLPEGVALYIIVDGACILPGAAAGMDIARQAAVSRRCPMGGMGWRLAAKGDKLVMQETERQGAEEEEAKGEEEGGSVSESESGSDDGRWAMGAEVSQGIPPPMLGSFRWRRRRGPLGPLAASVYCLHCVLPAQGHPHPSALDAPQGALTALLFPLIAQGLPWAALLPTLNQQLHAALPPSLRPTAALHASHWLDAAKGSAFGQAFPHIRPLVQPSATLQPSNSQANSKGAAQRPSTAPAAAGRARAHKGQVLVQKGARARRQPGGRVAAKGWGSAGVGSRLLPWVEYDLHAVVHQKNVCFRSAGQKKVLDAEHRAAAKAKAIGKGKRRSGPPAPPTVVLNKRQQARRDRLLAEKAAAMAPPKRKPNKKYVNIQSKVSETLKKQNKRREQEELEGAQAQGDMERVAGALAEALADKEDGNEDQNKRKILQDLRLRQQLESAEKATHVDDQKDDKEGKRTVEEEKDEEAKGKSEGGSKGGTQGETQGEAKEKPEGDKSREKSSDADADADATATASAAKEGGGDSDSDHDSESSVDL